MTRISARPWILVLCLQLLATESSEAGKPIVLKASNREIDAIALSRQRNECYVTSFFEFQVWNLKTRKCTFRKAKFSPIDRTDNVFTRDGSRCLTFDRGLCVYDCRNRKVLRCFGPKSDDKYVDCADLSPDGKWVAALHVDKYLRKWNAQTGQLELEYKLAVRTELLGARVAISPNGKLVATTFSPDVLACEKPYILLWNTANKTVKKMRVEDGSLLDHIQLLGFSADSKTLFVGDSRIYPLDLRVGKLDFDLGLKGFGEPGTTTQERMVFSSNRSKLVTFSDNAIRIYDSKTRKRVLRLPEQIKVATCVSFSEDGNWIAAGSQDGTVRIWTDLSPANRKVDSNRRFVLPKPQELAFPNPKVLAFNHRTHQAFVADHEKLGQWDLVQGKEISSHRIPSYCDTFVTQDGATVTLVGRHEDTVQTLDKKSGKTQTRVRFHKSLIYVRKLTANAKWAVSLHYDGFIRKWNVSTGKLVAAKKVLKPIPEKRRYGLDVPAIELNRNATMVAVGARFPTSLLSKVLGTSQQLKFHRQVALWEPRSNKLHKFPHRSKSGWAKFVNGDKNLLLQVAKGRRSHDELILLKLTQPFKAKVLRSWPNVGVIAKHVSPDGKLLVHVDGEDMVLFSAQTGAELGRLRGHVEDINAICFSGDGNWILTNTSGYSFRTWNIAAIRPK